MNVNSHTNTFRTNKLEEENELPHHSPAQNASESKTTQVALESLDRQRELVSEEIKEILLTLSPQTDRAELENKIKNLVQKIKTLAPNEEMQENLNHLQISLYKFEFEELSHAIRDVRPFMWNDLPEEMHVYILSQMSFEELLKLQSPKEFRDVVDLEIIERINRNKISLDLDKKTFAILLRALKNQGIHLKYLGLKSGKCNLKDFEEIINSCPNLEHIQLGCLSGKINLADKHAGIINLLKQDYGSLHSKKNPFLTSDKLPVIARAPLKTLISLKLEGQDLGDAEFACICNSSNLINLKILDFSTNKVTSAGFQAIAQAKFKLEELYLNNNKITSFVNSLDSLKELKILDLRKNQINAAAIETILQLSEHALSCLDLSHNQLTDESLPQTRSLENSKLAVLKLGGNKISSPGIEKIAPLFPRLSGLYLDANKELDINGLELILKEKPKLRELGLSGTSIGEEGVIKIFDFENFSFFKKLNLGQHKLSTKFWLSLGRFKEERTHIGSNLEELNISYQENDKEKIEMLLKIFPLKILNLSISSENYFKSWVKQIKPWGKSHGCEISVILGE